MAPCLAALRRDGRRRNERWSAPAARRRRFPAHSRRGATLALRLVDQGLLAEAESHLRWCLQQKPDDAALRKSYQQTLAKRFDREGGETR